MNRETAWQEYLAEVPGADLVPGAAPEQVCNGSFARGDGGRPEGWHLVAGTLGASTEWLASGGVDGGRCLRVSPKGGGASWRADPVVIHPGAEYLFRCAMKRDGNRHWAHACKVSWVSLVFCDAAGNPCRSDAATENPFVIIRCRKTDGWVEGWRFLRAPRDAQTLHIGFRITRGEPSFDDPYGFRRFWHGDIDTGNWWIDDVRLDRMPLETIPATGRLTVHVPGGDARLKISSEKGETVTPPGVVAYQWGGGCFHPLREHVQWRIPPGAYVVEAIRGFQRRLFHRKVRVEEGRDASVTVELPRIVDLPAQGWYDGDHHNHLSFHGDTRHPMLTIDDVCRIARGEGLDFLSFCGEIVDQHAYADWREAGKPDRARPDGAFETPDLICSISHEVTQDLLGHICLVNAPGHVAPGHPWWITPTNAEIVESVRKGDSCGTRGAVVMAHPYDTLTAENLFQVLADPERTGLHRELPVDVALGFADTMDFLAVEASPDLDLRFRDYYRLLNLGFRIGVTGASDVYADQGTEIIGSLRTMVRADAFTMDAVALGYRRQRTIAANGPILAFTANGGEIGDTIAGPGVCLAVKAYSNWGISRLQVVAGGAVVAEAAPQADGWASIESEVVLERSGWLIARVWGPGCAALNTQPAPEPQRAARGQWAVTSPIYVQVPGKPLLACREDAEYFVRWIDASCEAIRRRRTALEGRGPYGPAMSDAHVKTALDLFARGRAVFERLL
jgi:hypothetical protein